MESIFFSLLCSQCTLNGANASTLTIWGIGRALRRDLQGYVMIGRDRGVGMVDLL